MASAYFQLLCVFCGVCLARSLAEQNVSRPLLRGSNASLVTQSHGHTSTVSHIVWKPSLTEYCLSADGNRVGNGVKVQLWQCDASWQSPGQNFYFDSDWRIRVSTSPEYCVVIDRDEYNDGSKIQLWRCDENNANQRWDFSRAGQIRAMHAPTSKCLVIDGNTAFNGAKLQLWTCANADVEAQSWFKIVLGWSGRTAYAAPNEDKTCLHPFSPVTESLSACAAAADALVPGSGCYDSPWATVVSQVDKPSWPRGCQLYSACQGGCGLYFNPNGGGSSCPTQGDCMSIDVICELELP